jgi:ubiquinone/menaquinone biosynthesis C-methylase UbiE
MRMLEIGPRSKPALEELEGEHEVHYLDAVDRMEDGKNLTVHTWERGNELPYEDGFFDYIYCAHILEHIRYYDEVWAFEDLARVLAAHGQMHILVPSGDWIGKALVAGDVHGAFKGFMFGGMIDEFDVHVNVFTRNSLITVLQYVNLNVYQCVQQPYHMTQGDQTIEAMELYAIAVKLHKE